MALLMYDGFDYLSSNTTAAGVQLNGRGWTNTTISRAAGRFGGFALYNGSPIFNIPVVATGVMGFAITTTSTGAFLGGFSDSNQTQVGLFTSNTTGKLCVVRASSSTVLAQSNLPWMNNQWNYVEFKATINNTTGSFEVRLNGVQVPELTMINQDTQNTANASFNQIFLTSSVSTHDDLYVLDTSGSAPYNDFLGDVRVQTLFANVAGSSTQWTPLGGTNVSNVDDGGLDGDTTYNSSVTAGQIDLFQCGPDLIGTPTILAAQVFVDARKDDSGTRNIRTKLKSGATIADGASHSLSSANYGNFVDRYVNDPATGAAWTMAGINAVEVGYENL